MNQRYSISNREKEKKINTIVNMLCSKDTLHIENYDKTCCLACVGWRNTAKSCDISFSSAVNKFYSKLVTNISFYISTLSHDILFFNLFINDNSDWFVSVPSLSLKPSLAQINRHYHMANYARMISYYNYSSLIWKIKKIEL